MAIVKESGTSLEKLVTPKLEQLRLCSFTGDQFAKYEFPPLTFLMEPWLTHPSYNLLYATRGLGKTYFCLAVSLAVATGGTMLDWQAREACKVLYVDGEVGGTEMQTRLNSMSHGERYSNLTIACVPEMILNDYPSISLTDPAWQLAFAEYIEEENIKMVIWDNIGTLFSGININDGKDWTAPNNFFIALRSRGITSILVHHAGKNPDLGPRGASNLEDNVNMSIALTPISGNNDTCKFKMEWTKSRTIHGETLAERIIEITDGGTHPHFAYSLGTTDTKNEIIQLHRDGKRNFEIVKITGRSTSYISETVNDYENSLLI